MPSRPRSRALVFESFGVAVRVDVANSLREQLLRALPPGWAVSAREDHLAEFGVHEVERNRYVVSRDGAPVTSRVGPELAVDIVDAQVRMVVAVNAPERAFVHAGVVAVDDRAIVLPGRSFAGKTTLVETLIKRGATYYSDEYAVYDSDGFLHPFAKPLSIRSRDHANRTEDVRAVDTPVESLGARAGDKPIRTALIAALQYVPQSGFDVESRSPAQGALLLLSHALAGRTDPARVLPVLRRAATGTSVLQGVRGDADEAAAALLSVVSSAPTL